MSENLYTTMDSPIGRLRLTGARSAAGIVLDSVAFTDHAVHSGPMDHVARQLRAYFAGELTRFEMAHTERGTPFQRRVWAAVDEIPYGTTVSYGELAARIGAPRERVRAVAAAVGANPLLVVRPCHRVVGADGSMTGYAGGVPRKQFLLSHEGALRPGSRSAPRSCCATGRTTGTPRGWSAAPVRHGVTPRSVDILSMS